MPKPKKNAGKKPRSKNHVKHTVKRAHVHIRPSSKHISKKQGKAAGKKNNKLNKRVVKASARGGKVVFKNVHKNVKIAPKVVKESLKERREREAEAILNEQKKHNIKVVEEVFTDPYFAEHMTTTMGEKSVDVVKILYKKPQTDEKLTEKLEMKINEVRRILNVMNGHGITKYDVTKDSSGWLIFTWRIDAEKLAEYAIAQKQAATAYTSVLPDNCNDFFMCKKCYENNMIVLPFDSAIEYNFKCVDCGGKLEMIDRENAELFVKGLKK